MPHTVVCAVDARRLAVACMECTWTGHQRRSVVTPSYWSLAGVALRLVKSRHWVDAAAEKYAVAAATVRS